MKIALISDIHANELAFRAVARAARIAQVDLLLVAGDIVGYYFSPRQVLDLLGAWPNKIVRGNHEEMLLKARYNRSYLTQVDKIYGTGLRTALENLDSQQLDYLCTLPHPLDLELDGKRILLSHGAPWDLNAYIYPDTTIDFSLNCRLEDFDLIITGHTHHPNIWQLGQVLIVNPGSVGQPRDWKPGACWALYDTLEHRVVLKRENYDSSALIDECRIRHPELPFLADVLERKN